MLLTNSTPFPAMLFRGVVDDRRLFASVVCRVTYSIVDGTLKAAPEQVWRVSAEPWEGPYGPMDSDEVFYTGGVDVFAFGSARPHRPETGVMEVSVEVGSSFTYSIVVFGRRVWRKVKGSLVASPPAPFSEIPLTLEHAYGGKDTWDGLDVPYPANPLGKGFYVDEKNAEGGELPNIEEKGRLISRWDDRPEPVGVACCGMAFGPRLEQSLVFDEKTGALTEIKPTLFNSAFPAMVAPRVLPGDRVRIRGMLPGRSLEFTIPPSGLGVRVAIGAHEAMREPAVAQVGVEVDLERVFLTYRYPFRYVFTPHEKRSCELVYEPGVVS
ncbi:MAG TPA: DUF2169 domain-containing protein [Deltaproteobacteria bacterium]|nr:DUF2169 domain-containing protein [Deltaproteobacteria bacterium]HPP81236.1 DUF2169 domain-containing protein [Deltaproteobacteria bacterium]